MKACSDKQFAYVTEFDLSIDNGPGVNERESVDALIRGHHDQVICVAPYPENPGTYLNPKIEYVFPHRSSPVRYPVFLGALFLRILKVNRAVQFNAIVFRLGRLPIVPIFLRVLLRKPLFLKTLDGYALFAKKQRNWYRKVFAKLSSPIYKAVIKRASGADTVSKVYIEWLSHFFGADRDKLRVLPNGANTELFIPRDRKKCRSELGFGYFTRIIGYVGALDSLRQLGDLIYCLPDVQDIGRVGLVLVGKGPDLHKLEGLVRSLGIEESVVFAGVVPYAEVPKYMNSFDIGIDLSLVPMRINGKVLYASYSQKIPQYLSCGLPVVAWDTPDTRFLEDERIGYVTPIRDIRSLAKTLRRTLQMDNSDYLEMCIRARKYAYSHFSTHVVAGNRMEFWNFSLSANKRNDKKSYFVNQSLQP